MVAWLAGAQTWGWGIPWALGTGVLVGAFLARLGRKRIISLGAGVAVAVLFLAPIPPLVFNGMETLLQVVLSLALAERLVRHVTQPRPSDAVALALLAGAVTSVRYEGLFLVAVSCALLLMRREFRLAAFIAFAGALPPCAYGWVSASQGWSLLPNSLLLKGAALSLSQPRTLLQAVIRPFGTIDDTLSGGQIPRWQPLVVLILLIALWELRLRARKALSESRLVPAFFFCAVAGLHMALISSEWFFRYGAYLSVLGLWALVCVLEGASFARGPQAAALRLAGAAVGLLVLYPSVLAGLSGSGETPLASRNIHEQQEQMGLFLASYYTGQAVAANDIGAIDFYADLRTVDLYGLASMTVARAKREGAYDWEAIDGVTRESHAKIAVVYDKLFLHEGLPPSWVKVAEWTIPDNVVCGGDTVSWYALERDEVSPLAAHLREFAPRLPKEVRVRVYPPG
jgi:MFS family permease